MKRVCVYLQLLPVLCASQVSWNRAIQRNNETAQQVAAVDGKFFYAAYSNSPGFQDTTWIYGHRGDGSNIFSKPVIIDPYGYLEITQMLPTSDHHLLVAGWYRHCDYVDTLCKSFLMKIDTTGAVAFQTAFQPVHSFQGSPMLRVMEASDQSYYVINDTANFHFSKTGKLVRRKKAIIGGMSAIAELDNEWLLVSGKFFNTYAHYRMDTSLTFNTAFALVNSAPVRRYFKTTNGELIAVLADGALERLSTQPAVLANAYLNLIPVGEDFANDTLYMISRDHQYKAISATFSTLHSAGLSVPGHSATGMAASGGKAAFISQGVSATYTSLAGPTGVFSGITVFPKLSGWNYPKNAGVLSVKTNTAFVSTMPIPNSQVIVLNANLDLKCVVQNQGTVAISGFYLNCGKGFATPVGCGAYYYHNYFNTGPIAPGGTVEVSTGLFTINWIDEIYNGQVPANYSLSNLRIYTTLPDHEFERNHLGDAANINVQMVVTGVEEEAGALVAAYPNPASDVIVFELPGEISGGEVFSSTGSRVLQIEATLNRNLKLSISSLPPGIYLASFRSGNRNCLAKFVKQ
jgi:hypothetical protein